MRESLCAVLAMTVLATVGCGSYNNGQAQAAPLTSTASDDPTAAAITYLPVVISGGHDTDPRDHGRPVVLVAGGLGVAPDVFRDAFSGVHPVAPGSQPDQARAQQNKAVLLAALAPYGITNKQLDTVSDYYRYQPGSGALWPTRAAVITATVKAGTVTSFEVSDGGAGYSSGPSVSVPGALCGPVAVNLSFSRDLARNGAIESVTLSR
jgi:hypothetical protein